MPRELSLVIPTYNEAENVEELIKRTAASLRNVDFEAIFVDDGSPDGTAMAIEWFGKGCGDFHVLRRKSRGGLSSAVMDGVRIAKGDVVAVMDGDLQHPPELLPEMLGKIKRGNDLIIASRYLKGGMVEHSNLLRKAMSKIAVILVHFLLPKTRAVEDVVSGFFMFRKSVLKNARFSLIGYKILLEIIEEGNVNNMAEVPYVFAIREKGTSKLGPTETLKYIALLFKLRLSKNFV